MSVDSSFSYEYSDTVVIRKYRTDSVGNADFFVKSKETRVARFTRTRYRRNHQDRDRYSRNYIPIAIILHIYINVYTGVCDVKWRVVMLQQ